jgi:AraC-like DNA-binding protein
MLPQVSGQIIKLVNELPEPKHYFQGLDWTRARMPREILCFTRTSQDHRTTGWQGISAKAGRYDQHARHVMIISLDGEGLIGAESEVWQLSKGKVAVLNPFTIHYYLDLPEKFCWLFITFELHENLQAGVRMVNSDFSKKLTTFLQAYQRKNAIKASRILGEILTDLEGQKPLPEVARQSEASLIAQIKEHVMANLENDLSLQTIAEKMNISESHLRAQFRDHAGISLGHFVRSLRLVKSTYLLQKEKSEVAAIAKECGFRSLASFTRAFRRMYEMTPSVFRKKNQPAP